MVVLRVGWLALAFVWARWAGGSVAAQADASRDAEAFGLFEAAMAAFDDGRFEDAYEYFERSYALSGRPQLLFNLASTSERLRRDAEAVGYYERYLAAIPDAENRRFVEGRIAFLREAIARSAVESPPPQVRDPVPVPVPVEVARQSQAAEAGPSDPHPSPVDREPPPNRTRRRALWASLAAVAAGGLAAGLVLGLRDPGVQAPLPGDIGVGGVVVTLASGTGHR